jgi:hypothetical protein
MPLFQAAPGSSRVSALVSPSSAGGSLLRRILYLPLDVVTSPTRATTVLLLLFVTAFLCLRSPLMILVLPTLAWRFISTNQNFWGWSYHYDLVLMPVIFAALIDGMLRAQRSRWRPLPSYVRAAPALALTVGLILCSQNAFRGLVDPSTYQPSPRAQAAGRVLSKIPDGASVESDAGATSMLTRRTRVLLMGNAAPVVPDFVLLDAHTLDHPPPADAVQYAESLHWSATYVLVDSDQDFTLLTRVH